MTDDVSRDVTNGTKESKAEPPAPWRFTLRASTAERDILNRVVKAHARMGLTISLNDAVLVLIRRAATPDPDTQEEAWRQIEQHWSDCAHGCDTVRIKCPEGWRLRDALHRVMVPGWRPEHLRGTRSTPSPAPPPPPITSAPDTSATSAAAVDVAPQRWRRYLGFAGRKAS